MKRHIHTTIVMGILLIAFIITTTPHILSAQSNFMLRDDGSVIINDHDCDAEPQFEVADSVEIQSRDFQFFYGHPQIDGSFYTGELYPGRTQYPAEAFSYVRQNNRRANAHFIAEGPECINGVIFFKISGIDRIEQRRGFYFTETAPSIWVNQNEISRIDPINYTAEFGLVAQELSFQNTSAPLLDANTQLSFVSAGGGGLFDPYVPWKPTACGLNELFTTVGYAPYFNVSWDWGSTPDFVQRPYCMEIYPVPEGVGTVRIYQPDGSLYQELQISTQQTQFEVFQTDDMQSLVDTVSLQVPIPDTYGIMTGIWRIEAQIDEAIFQRAFYVIADDWQQFAVFECDRAHPNLFAGVFAPDDAFDIVLIERNPDSRIEYSEAERWQFEFDESGRQLFHINHMPPRIGIYALVERGNQWESLVRGDNIRFNRTADILQTAVLDRSCVEPQEMTPIDLNRLVIGTGTFVADLDMDATISISFQWLLTVSSGGNVNNDITLTIVDPDGEVIATHSVNDGIEVLNVPISAEGSYVIRIETANDFPTRFRIPAFIIETATTGN